MRQAIALVTSVTNVTGMWIAGNKDWRGWAIGLANQAVWLAFIVVFAAWGLLPLSAFLVVTYTRNLLRWRAEARTEIALREMREIEDQRRQAPDRRRRYA